MIENNELFSKMNIEEINDILKKCEAKTVKFKKDEVIISPGNLVEKFGIILSGNLMGLYNDYWGNRTILTKLKENDMFGEAFALSRQSNVGVSVVSVSDSEILFIEYDKFISLDNKEIIKNMLKILSEKNVFLTSKIECLSKRSIRSKLLSYLSDVALKKNTNEFEIPFDRQELADFLGVDRSALSSELSKLQKENILKFNKNKFKLI